MQHGVAEEQRLLAEQLQIAVDSRVVIEQAKGVLAARTGIGTGDAFNKMRNYARTRNLLLADVAAAAAAVNRDLGAEVVGPQTA